MSDINGDIEKIIENWDTINFTSVTRDIADHVERTDILDFGNEGFLLTGLLTDEECSSLIDAGETIGFKQIEGATQEYRCATRIMVQSDELASVLWKRIRPYLSDVEITGDPHDVHIHGVGSLLKGKWQPLKLNNHFRLCKYQPGGHFAPHYDGFFTETSQVRSLISVVVYLNENFNHGHTNFLNETHRDYLNEEGKLCAEEKDIIYSVKPESGTGLLFHHHRLHEGEAVRNGVKYILRTDVMFEHVDREVLDATQEEALQIAQEAERFECCGHQKQATELFNKAFAIFPILAETYKT